MGPPSRIWSPSEDSAYPSAGLWRAPGRVHVVALPLKPSVAAGGLQVLSFLFRREASGRGAFAI